MAGGRPRPNPGFQRVPLDERLDAGRAPEPDHRLVDPEERPLPRQLGRERLQAQTHHDFLEFFIEADALHRAGHDPAIDEVRLPRFEAGCGGELDLDLRPLRFPVRPEKPPGGERRENRKDPRPRDAQAGSRHDFAVVIFIVVRFAHGERKSARESLEYPCKRFTALNPASRWTLIRCWKFQLTRKSTRLTAYTERMSWFFWKEASPIPCGMEDADDGNRLFKWHVKEEVASESRKHKPPDLFVPPGGMTHQGAKFGIRCEQIRCVQDCLAHPPGGLGIVRGNVIKNLSDIAHRSRTDPRQRHGVLRRLSVVCDLSKSSNPSSSKDSSSRVITTSGPGDAGTLSQSRSASFARSLQGSSNATRST